MQGDLRFVARFGTAFSICYYEHEYHTGSYQCVSFTVLKIVPQFTQISLQVLREGRLNKLISRNESVLDVLNHFYFGTFLTFYKVWSEEKKTIVDTGYVLKGKCI